MKEKQEFLTRKQLAEVLGVSTMTIQAWIEEGLIPFYRPKRRWTYFRYSEVLEGLQKCRHEKLERSDEHKNLDGKHRRRVKPAGARNEQAESNS